MAVSRQRSHILSHDELAQMSGLHKATIQTLSLSTTWSHVTVDTMDRFCRACGVNVLNPQRDLAELQKSMITLFDRANWSQRRFLSRLLQLAQTVTNSGASSGRDASGASNVASISSSREAMKMG